MSFYLPTADPTSTIPSHILSSLLFERSQWSTPHSTHTDPFYTALSHRSPSSSTSLPPTTTPPGTLLHLSPSPSSSPSSQTHYTLPPGLSLSRYIYQSTTSTGTFVPVSAYILWPFGPRTSTSIAGTGKASASKRSYAQIVAWAHGTSGLSAPAAPSHTKNLWQHFLGPFALALQGYVVAGTDYAGLGVGEYPGTSASTSTSISTSVPLPLLSGEENEGETGAESRQTVGDDKKEAKVKEEGKGRRPIVHHYLNSPDHARDVVYSVLAAKRAFPEKLGGSRWVVAGHSQGGGAAWGVGQLVGEWERERMEKGEDEGKSEGTSQRREVVEGYLGAVAIAPVTRILGFEKDGGKMRGKGEGEGEGVGERAEQAAETETEAEVQLQRIIRGIILMSICPGIKDVWPEFQVGDILMPEGVRRMKQVLELGGCSGTNIPIFAAPSEQSDGLVKPGWEENTYLRKFIEETANGGKSIAGPLLVVQGEADPAVRVEVTTRSVKNTVERLGEEVKIEYIRLKGVSHNGACTAAQHVWMDWIRDRFEGKDVKKGLQERVIEPTMGGTEHQLDLNWWIAPAMNAWETP